MLIAGGRALLALLFIGLVGSRVALAGATERVALTASLQRIVDDYLAANAGTEGITAVSASISLAGGKEPAIDLVAGRVGKAANEPPVTPATLFPIGSITKSMTSTVILQLVHEGVLSLDAPIGRWLPEYPAWGAVTLRRLLNMTSGIPSYDNTDAFLQSIAKYGIGRHFSPAVLLSFTDPDLPGAPKPTTGFDYANVNYIIAQMVVESATGRSLDVQIQDRLLKGHGLDDTFYSSGSYPDSVLARIVSSYMTASPTPILAGLVGQDLTPALSGQRVGRRRTAGTDPARLDELGCRAYRGDGGGPARFRSGGRSDDRRHCSLLVLRGRADGKPDVLRLFSEKGSGDRHRGQQCGDHRQSQQSGNRDVRGGYRRYCRVTDEGIAVSAAFWWAEAYPTFVRVCGPRCPAPPPRPP
jgi:CubicO group peptidase (beta-lactamase class C family)